MKKTAHHLQPNPTESRGSILSALLQHKIAQKAPKIQLAGIIVQRNYWALTTLVLSLALIICLVGYFYQTTHYENHIRTLMVKLYPNGQYDIQKVNFEKMPSYFLTTLDSLMSQFVERRYSKNSDSIAADYGFAYQFMSPEMRNQFLNEYHAGRVAHQHENCRNCTQVQVKVGAIQHYEDDVAVTQAKTDHEYRSTVFATVTRRTQEGNLIDVHKKIITLVWRIKTMRELNNAISSLRADPIGLVIVRATLKDDPTLNKKT